MLSWLPLANCAIILILTPIEVVTEFLLGDILRNKDANRRIIKWALELSPYSQEF
jgi:hypothetical protein